MSEITFKVEDLSPEALKELDFKIGKALYLAGIDVVAGTVEYMTKIDFTGRDIIDTGKLMQSISFITSDYQSGINKVKQTAGNSEKKALITENDIITGKAPKNTMIWGSNVEYAEFVNNGTNKQDARHFLENGFYQSQKRMKQDIKQALEGEI